MSRSRPDRMRGRVQGWPRSTESLVLARNGRARAGEVSSGGESNQGEGERQVRLSGDLRYFRDLGGPHLAFLSPYFSRLCSPCLTWCCFYRLKKDVQLGSCELSFIWGKTRTAAQEAASQIALIDCSKATVGESPYIRFW